MSEFYKNIFDQTESEYYALPFEAHGCASLYAHNYVTDENGVKYEEYTIEDDFHEGGNLITNFNEVADMLAERYGIENFHMRIPRTTSKENFRRLMGKAATFFIVHDTIESIYDAYLEQDEAKLIGSNNGYYCFLKDARSFVCSESVDVETAKHVLLDLAEYGWCTHAEKIDNGYRIYTAMCGQDGSPIYFNIEQEENRTMFRYYNNYKDMLNCDAVKGFSAWYGLHKNEKLGCMEFLFEADLLKYAKDESKYMYNIQLEGIIGPAILLDAVPVLKHLKFKDIYHKIYEINKA